MGVGQQNKIDLCGADRQLPVDKVVSPLLHAAVHESVMAPRLQQSAASRHLMGGAQKCDEHTIPSYAFLHRRSRQLYIFVRYYYIALPTISQ